MKNEECKNCKYKRGVQATGGFRFLGCECPPYKGKWIAEIENCPKYAEGAKYKCKKAFAVDWYDEDGFFDFEKQLKVNKKDIYTVVTVARPYADNDEAIHLEDDNGNWLELMPDTIEEHFELLKGGADK